VGQSEVRAGRSTPTTDLAVQARLIGLPLLPGLEVLNRWIPTPSQGDIDTLQHEIVDFDPLIEGDLPQRLIDRLRQVEDLSGRWMAAREAYGPRWLRQYVSG
jgi:hypothetical protein